MNRICHRPRRRGATLVELLVVIIVLLAVTAAAIPVMSPLMQGRRVREASRIVNNFLHGARNRSIQTGRPFGVMFDRVTNLPQACVTLHYCEVPPPYAGDFTNSRIVVRLENPIVGLSEYRVSGFSTNDVGWQGLLRPGDLIQFQSQGAMWRIDAVPAGVDANGLLTGAPFYDLTTQSFTQELQWYLTPVDLGPVPYYGAQGPVPIPPRTRTTGASFQIFRQPQRSASGSLQLPEGTAIDLAFSGDSTTVLTPNPLIPVNVDVDFVVTFAPSGAVDDIYRWVQVGGINRRQSFEVVSPLYFLIGKRDRIPNDPTAQPGEPVFNVQDTNNNWVVITPLTGLISSAECGAVNQADPLYPPVPIAANQLDQARLLAREALILGGR